MEYLLRCLSVPRPLSYMGSIYGVIDLVSFIPFLLEILFPQLHFLSVIRILRLLRIFRVFKMVRFLEESNGMLLSLWESRRKILIFLFFVLLLTVIFGSMNVYTKAIPFILNVWFVELQKRKIFFVKPWKWWLNKYIIIVSAVKI